VCGQSLKTIFQNFKKHHGNIIYQKIHLIFEIILILSKLQLQNFHENSPCFKSPFICFKHSRKTCGHVVFFFQKSFPYQMFTKSFRL